MSPKLIRVISFLVLYSLKLFNSLLKRCYWGELSLGKSLCVAHFVALMLEHFFEDNIENVIEILSFQCFYPCDSATGACFCISCLPFRIYFHLLLWCFESEKKILFYIDLVINIVFSLFVNHSKSFFFF